MVFIRRRPTDLNRFRGTLVPLSEYLFMNMNCTLRTHYSLNFSHHELAEIGFDVGDLIRLFHHTSKKTRKFHVYWDNNNIPHFSSPEDGSNPIRETYRSFYQNLLSWCYHKTHIKSYRVIHRSNNVHLLFGHYQNSVNPQIVFPDYDFGGFDPHLVKYKDGSSHLRWKIHMSRDETVPKNFIRPAVVRP